MPREFGLRPTESSGVDAVEYCRNHEFAEAVAICLWANYWALNSITAIERQFGLNRDDCNVLITLWRFGQATATDISSINGRPKNSVSRSVKRLLDNGLIETTPDKIDARKKLLTMTRRGTAIMKDIKPIFIKYQESMLAQLSSQQRETVHRLLLKTITDVEKWHEDWHAPLP